MGLPGGSARDMADGCEMVELSTTKAGPLSLCGRPLHPRQATGWSRSFFHSASNMPVVKISRHYEKLK